ncbi:hypothetical protein C8J57DRAFT_1498453 [Mycena rebaudengoi]|nr:hypothetical protein C8J57DRAFT_1498453 [Mycena rebaudengoi]
MPFFSTSRTSRGSAHRHGLFHRRDRDNVARGYKSALSNPNTTSRGRKHAKAELHAMGRSAHVPFWTKVKRTLGIRSTPRRQRVAATRTRRERRHY